MIFQHTLDKVLSGKKSQTRRLIKGVNLAVDIYGNPGATDSPNFDLLGPIQVVTTEKGRLLYEVGQIHAVQPGRGKPTIQCVVLRTAEGTIRKVVDENSGQLFQTLAEPLRIQIAAIRYEDVRNISAEDARAEGFESQADFLGTWCMMHDATWAKRERCFVATSPDLIIKTLLNEMHTRPVGRYRAWALTFGQMGNSK